MHMKKGIELKEVMVDTVDKVEVTYIFVLITTLVTRSGKSIHKKGKLKICDISAE